MQHSEEIDKIMPALVKAQAAATAVGKSGKHPKYMYANLMDYQSVAEPVFKELGLALTASVAQWVNIEGRTTNSGSAQYACAVEVQFKLVHESGQWVAVTAWGEGQDHADKGLYKALTGARKYGIAMLLNLVTHDDPEADTKVGIDKRGPKASDKNDPLEDL